MGDTPDYTIQPPPKVEEGATSAHDLVTADLKAWGWADATAPAIAVTQGRKGYGLAKYGTVVHRANGRDNALDAEDEAGDLVVYLRNLMDEQPEWTPMFYNAYQDALWILCTIASFREHGEPPPYLAKMRAGLTPHPDNVVLDERDTGYARDGNIPAIPGQALWICGAMMVGGYMCLRHLDEQQACEEHGGRMLP